MPLSRGQLCMGTKGTQERGFSEGEITGLAPERDTKSLLVLECN